MLCQFTFKNFKSYKNETTLDLRAVSSQGFPETLLTSGDDKQPYLPVAAIYGPNAGGKSNVLEALKCLHDIVMNPILLLKNGNANASASFGCTPFMFDKTSKSNPTEFEIFFRAKSNYEYRYNLSVLNNAIVKESLYRKKAGAKGHPAMIFERGPEINIGTSIKRSLNAEIDVNDHIPFLSFLAINYKLEPITDAISGMEQFIIKDYSNPFAESNLLMDHSDSFKAMLVTLMNDAGVKVNDFEFVKVSPEKDAYQIYFEHKVGKNTYKLNINQESAGTQKLFSFLPLVIIALIEGKLLIIDELDAKLHPKLLKFIIMLFKNPEINKRGAQLLFTSHDVSTMKSSVFRTDEIWFACQMEDESSDLYSLYELRDENNNRISPSAAFDKQYLEGRYGADPYFKNMMEWK